MDKFYSKVLLFGEYSIIKGSNGLAVPFESFHGQLEFDSEKSLDSKASLLELARYLDNSSILSKNIDTQNFIKDIENGLYFNSIIPQGYGVGSSGALCASILSKYGRNIKRDHSYSKDELRFLQDLMALMESFYHGTSSGLDPLISFVNEAVFIKGRNEIEVKELSNLDSFGDFYLIDSGIPRKTSPLVHKFMKMCENNDFAAKLEKLVINSNQLIDAFINQDKASFEQNLYEVSRFQYLNFESMIPKNLKELWFYGLESQKFLLKLCGAGGGGFLMAYVPENDLSILKDHKLIKLNL